MYCSGKVGDHEENRSRKNPLILFIYQEKPNTNELFILIRENKLKDKKELSTSAGSAQHFFDFFQETDVEAALAAGIFQSQQVPVGEVKEAMRRNKIETR